MLRWRTSPGGLVSHKERAHLPAIRAYYDAFKPLCRSVEIWQTIYNHPMADGRAIAEWFRGSALRPFLDALDEDRVGEFVSAYVHEIELYYPVRADGRRLLQFPRLFMVITR